MEIIPILERLDRAVVLLEQIVAATRAPALAGATSPPPGEEGLWNTKQVATYLKCSESKVYKAAEAGGLPCVRDGRSLRFEPEAIRAYIRGRARRASSMGHSGA